jgi:hypothetical protein
MKKSYPFTVATLAGALASLACLTLATTASTGVAAQSGPSSQARSAATWRCGNTYTDQPCAGGTPVQADDIRSPEARRASDEATRRSERSADAMERDRLRLERAAVSRGGATVFADHRVAEARERTMRRAAETAARQRQDKANRSSKTGKAGKKHPANGDFIAQVDAPVDATASSAKKKRGAVN